VSGIEGASNTFVKPLSKDSESLPADASHGKLMRVTVLAYLSAMAIGCILAFYSVIFRRADFFLGAIFAAVVVGAARTFLQDKLAASAREMNTSGDEGSPWAEDGERGDGRASELVHLLREWENLERARGTPDFDPWALQSTRNEIRLAVQSDPALEMLFRLPR